MGGSAKIDHGNTEDDNDKYSKIQRNSENFITRALVFMGALTLLAFGLGNSDVFAQKPPGKTAGVVNVYNANLDAQHQKQLDEKKHLLNLQAVESILVGTVEALDKKVRARKAIKGVHMEVDTEGKKLTERLQKATLELLEHRYGANQHHTKFRVAVDVRYPDSITKDPAKKNGRLVIELAPYELIPCSVFYFLEEARTFVKGEFNRNAGHVLQVWVQSTATQGKRDDKSMPFQEYSPDFPHKQYTTGYAGRPSGPEWYVSIEDNTENHGPGSQQDENPYEADSNFGSIVDDPENFETIRMIHSVPQHEWLDDKNCIQITKMTILANSIDEPSVFTDWKMPTPK